jgi:hypothetical protein
MEWVPDDQWIVGVDEPYAFVRTDAAFVVVASNLVSFLKNEIADIGPLGPLYSVDLNSMDIIGRKVKKVGRTTGLQTGVIVAYSRSIGDKSQEIDDELCTRPPNYYSDFVIAPTGESEFFSYAGDSGSPILLDTEDADNNRPLGLLWGGGPADIGRQVGLEDLTDGIDLGRILDRMGLELV